MENENDDIQEVDETIEEEVQDEETQEEDSEGTQEDDTDWKAEAEKLKGQNKRLKTKLEKLDKPSDSKKSNTDTWDYGQLAYLEMKGVKTDAEMDFVKKMMDKTGDGLKEVIADDYVQNRLKSIREEKATKAAIPSNTRRAQTSGKDQVDYWLTKGELPPTDQVELRRKVVNAKIEREKQKSKFSDSPIVGGKF